MLRFVVRPESFDYNGKNSNIAVITRSLLGTVFPTNPLLPINQPDQVCWTIQNVCEFFIQHLVLENDCCISNANVFSKHEMLMFSHSRKQLLEKLQNYILAKINTREICYLSAGKNKCPWKFSSIVTNRFMIVQMPYYLILDKSKHWFEGLKSIKDSLITIGLYHKVCIHLRFC